MNNIHNTPISLTDLNDLIKSHTTKPVREVVQKEREIFLKAFSHSSFAVFDSVNEPEDIDCCFPSVICNNERLEFFGDSCLNFITAEYLFTKYPTKDEGFLTKMRSKLVRDTQLANLGQKMGFNRWLLISNTVEKIHGRDNYRLIEDVFEAFIAAMYKTLGFYATRDLINTCFERYINLPELEALNDNYKENLIKAFHKMGWNHPCYKTSTKVDNIFTTNVLISGVLPEHISMFAEFPEIEPGVYQVCEGKGVTKKDSEKLAAQQVLISLDLKFE